MWALTVCITLPGIIIDNTAEGHVQVYRYYLAVYILAAIFLVYTAGMLLVSYLRARKSIVYPDVSTKVMWKKQMHMVKVMLAMNGMVWLYMVIWLLANQDVSGNDAYNYADMCANIWMCLTPAANPIMTLRFIPDYKKLWAKSCACRKTPHHRNARLNSSLPKQKLFFRMKMRARCSSEPVAVTNTTAQQIMQLETVYAPDKRRQTEPAIIEVRVGSFSSDKSSFENTTFTSQEGTSQEGSLGYVNKCMLPQNSLQNAYST